MILHLFRQVDSSVHSSKSIKELTGGDIHTYTAFGNYDRLCFTPVSRFVDYMKRYDNAYRWIGGHKDIMLYPVGNSGTERHFSFEQINPKQMNLGMVGKHKRRFLIMTMLFVSSEVKEKLTDYHALLKRCNAHVGDMIGKFNRAAGYSEDESVFGEVYGTFNSAEMCILWGANQFTDVQYLVDQIRYLSIKGHKTQAIPLFASSYTIVSMYQSISEILEQGPVKGGAMIQLASASLRHTSSVDAGRTPRQYLADLEGNQEEYPCELYKVEACSGEYDFLLNTKPPRLDLFRNDLTPGAQNLHYKNEYYKAHFSSTTTRLYYDDQDVPPGLESVDWAACRRLDGTGIWKDKPQQTVDDSSKQELLFGRKDFDEYENLLANSISDVSSMGTNLLLFYSDYMRALHMTPDRKWTIDLEYQVKIAIDALKAIAINDADPAQLYVDRRYIEWAERLLQTLRHQIHHITEAGKFTFEEPCLRANSTVEYDLLFHMFYGAAKEILSCIYDRNKGKSPAKQSSLVPVIKFQPTPIIESELWFDNDRVDKRLLDITIPYDAWGEPQFFIPYLVHEFYHYVAPMDRNVRNELFAKFLLSEIYRNAIQKYLYCAYEPYFKAKKTGGKKLSDMDLERLIVEFTDMLCEEMFRIIGAPGLSIKDKMIKDHSSDGADLEQMLRLQTIQNGDANWSIYKEAFLFWSSCLGIETEDESNGTGFLRKVIEESVGALYAAGKIAPSDDCAIFCEILTASIGIDKKKDKLTVTAELIESVSEKTEKVLSALKQSLEMLSDDSGADTASPKYWSSDDRNFNADSYPISAELLKNLREQSEACLHQSIRGLREIFPDYAMVTLCELGVKEYLLLFAAFQDKCFTMPDMYEIDDVSTLRVGCIIDHLLKKENSTLRKTDTTERRDAFKKYRESFVKLYSGYCSFCGWSDWDKRQTKQDIASKANDWFNEFVARLSNYYSRYGVYEELLDQLTSECFEPLCSRRKGRRIGSITKDYFKALGRTNANQLFKSSLEAIGRLQPQKNLNDMEPAAPKAKSKFRGAAGVSPTVQMFDGKRQNRVRWVMKAENMQEILQSIACDLQDIHLMHFKVKIGTNGLWYRGISNSEYGILPSAMVHFLDQDLRPEKEKHWDVGKNSMGMLWEYQYRLLQRFKYQADGAGEMINSASYKMTDYLALMQHYSQNTCYLDWSEEAFSSLYFALERFVTQDPKREEDKKHASLFVLDPMLYNRARTMLINKLRNKNPGIAKDTALGEQNRLLAEEPLGSIIDISLKWNLGKYSIFTMEDPTVFREMNREPAFVETDKPLDRKKAGHATLADFDGGKEVLNLPLAVHISRLNPRIRKQSGQFMVYSYMSRPAYVKGEKEDPKQYVRSADRFDYLALQRIQDYFLETFKDEYPFMYELRIHADAKESLAAYLRSAGINRFGIYPELDNLKL